MPQPMTTSTTDTDHAPVEKRLAAVLSLTMVVLMLLPMLQHLQNQPVDCFPLSYYPMFSKRRGEVVTMRHVVVVDDEGEQTVVPHWIVGQGGMNQVRKHIRRAVKRGDALSLGESVVWELQQRDDWRLEHAERLQVLSSKHRLQDFLQGDLNPISSQVEAEILLREDS